MSISPARQLEVLVLGEQQLALGLLRHQRGRVDVPGLGDPHKVEPGLLVLLVLQGHLPHLHVGSLVDDLFADLHPLNALVLEHLREHLQGPAGGDPLHPVLGTGASVHRCAGRPGLFFLGSRLHEGLMGVAGLAALSLDSPALVLLVQDLALPITPVFYLLARIDERLLGPQDTMVVQQLFSGFVLA